MLQELNLPPLQERRKQQRLTTLYKTVKGHIPAMPPENFLTPADRNRRRIRPTTFKDFSYDNTIARQEIRNSCGLKIPDSKTEQYRNSFFLRTVADWNKLENTVVTADSVTAFSSAVGRVLQGAAPPPPTHTHRERERERERVVYQGNRTEEKAFKKRKVFKEDSKDLTDSCGLKIPDSKTEQYMNYSS